MKYRNVSEFKQIAIINGKKEIIRKNEVIEVDKKFLNPAFEEVPEDTEVTVRKSQVAQNPALNDIQKSIEEFKKEISLTTINEIIDEKLKVLFEEKIEKELKNIYKRLEIIRMAVQTLELEVEQNLYGASEDIDKSPK